MDENDVLDDGEAEAVGIALPGAGRVVEALENMVEMGALDPFASVLDRVMEAVMSNVKN